MRSFSPNIINMITYRMKLAEDVACMSVKISGDNIFTFVKVLGKYIHLLFR
jgi:hypothetical protein